MQGGKLGATRFTTFADLYADKTVAGETFREAEKTAGEQWGSLVRSGHADKLANSHAPGDLPMRFDDRLASGFGYMQNTWERGNSERFKLKIGPLACIAQERLAESKGRGKSTTAKGKRSQGSSGTSAEETRAGQSHNHPSPAPWHESAPHASTWRQPRRQWQSPTSWWSSSSWNNWSGDSWSSHRWER